MQSTPHGKIRKITVGTDPKNALAFQVGGNVGNTAYLVSQIIEDRNHFFLFGHTRFLVYIKSGNEESLWKSFENVAISIEYYLPNGQEINII